MRKIKDATGKVIPVDSAPPGTQLHLGHVHIKVMSGAPRGYQRIYVELQADNGYVAHAVGPADIEVGGSLTLDCPAEDGEPVPSVRQDY